VQRFKTRSIMATKQQGGLHLRLPGAFALDLPELQFRCRPLPERQKRTASGSSNFVKNHLLFGWEL
jgi:hypothetical protein